MPTELETLSDVISLMELCAQLEEEQSRIFSALPKLKRAIESDAKDKHEAALRRSEEIAGQISALDKRLAEEMKEVRGYFSRVTEAIEARKREHEDYEKKSAATVPEPLKRHVAALFAEIPKPKDGAPGKAGDQGKPGDAGAPGRDGSILSRFRGNFSKETVYRADDVFTFRGSTYLVLRDVRGVLPTAEAQKGPKASYAVLAAAGAPGLPPIDGSAAAAVGQYVEGTRAFFSPVALVVATAKTVTSITLTAGEWDVTGVVDYSADPSTVISYCQQGTNTVTDSIGLQDTYSTIPFSSTVPTDPSLVIPTRRVIVTGTTTVYLVARAIFSVSTLSAYGQIRARRVV